MAGGRLSVGDRAPEFDVRDVRGSALRLDELLAQGPVILAFFPKAFTPG